MKMRAIAILPILVLSLTFAAAGYAQHTHLSQAAPAKESSANPMQECQKHHAEGSAALDQAEASLLKLKGTSLSDETRAAIDSAEQQIATAKHHLSMCPMANGKMMESGGMSANQPSEKMKCMSKVSKSE